MLYAALADTIDAQRSVIARQIAKDTQARNLETYRHLSLNDLAQIIEKTVVMVARYVRYGNQEEHLAYIQQLVRGLIERGSNTDDALVVTDIMIVKLHEMIAHEWSGDANATTRARYDQMITNVHNFGQITFKATRLALRQERIELQRGQ